MYLNAPCKALDAPPPAVSTSTSTSPTVPAGEVTVIDSELNAVIVPGLLPNQTLTGFERLVP